MFESLKGLLRVPVPTGRFEEVVVGRNTVEGVVRAEESLCSPVRGQRCVAFFYQGFLLITGGRQPALHKLKQIEGYGPFDLQMEGGVLPVVPPKPAELDQAGHLEFTSQHGSNYRAEEELILPGARVRVEGRVRREDGRLVLHLKAVEVLEARAATAATKRASGKRGKARRRGSQR